jgi:hypothetical protein
VMWRLNRRDRAKKQATDALDKARRTGERIPMGSDIHTQIEHLNDLSTGQRVTLKGYEHIVDSEGIDWLVPIVDEVLPTVPVYASTYEMQGSEPLPDLDPEQYPDLVGLPQERRQCADADDFYDDDDELSHDEHWYGVMEGDTPTAAYCSGA